MECVFCEIWDFHGNDDSWVNIPCGHIVGHQLFGGSSALLKVGILQPLWYNPEDKTQMCVFA